MYGGERGACVCANSLVFEALRSLVYEALSNRSTCPPPGERGACVRANSFYNVPEVESILFRLQIHKIDRG